MNDIGFDLRNLITNRYLHLDMKTYYSSLKPSLDKLDISFKDRHGKYHFYDDIIGDIIFDLELGL